MRRAFSLIETLVAIAIVAVLVGLLLPAVQRVREAANAARCRSNLRQIVLASHQYESAHASLPPGYLGARDTTLHDPAPGWDDGQWLGCLVFLLPHVEQGRSVALDLDKTGPHWWEADPAFGEAVIPLFRCPSDPESAPLGTVLRLGTYSVNGRGADGASYSPGDRRYGRTNYAGVAGACGQDAITSSPVDGPGANLRRYEGIYTDRSRTTFVQITDGASNTLAFGEGLGAGIWTWAGVGVGMTKFGLVNNAASFGSAHSGVNFAFADGSVRAIAPGATAERNPASRDWWLLQRLAGMRDGELIDAPQ